MKKTFFILGCCAILAGCDNSSERTDGYDKAYSNEAVTDEEKGIAAEPSAAGTSAATTPAEADTGTGTGTGTTETTEAPETTAATTDGAGQVAAAQTDNYERGESLVASSDCLACHQIDKKLVGPAYKDVAKKYEMNDKNIDYLSTKIIQGGAGVWGQIPMTPHPDLSKEDAAEMAKYVLSLNK